MYFTDCQDLKGNGGTLGGGSLGALDYLFVFQQGKPELRHHCAVLSHKSLFIYKPELAARRTDTSGGN